MVAGLALPGHARATRQRPSDHSPAPGAAANTRTKPTLGNSGVALLYGANALLGTLPQPFSILPRERRIDFQKILASTTGAAAASVSACLLSSLADWLSITRR